LEGVLRLEHIGIAVEDVDAMTRVLSDVLGRTPYKAESVQSEGVRTLFLDAGGAKLELLEATSAGSPMATFLEKRGAGMHHLAFEVRDLDSEIARLGGLGYKVLGNARPGADGKRIVFLHPRETGRVLIELCEQAGFPGAVKGDEPAPTSSVGITESSLSGPLAHSLRRHFRLSAAPDSESVAVVSVVGTADAPRILVRDCAAGDTEIQIVSAPSAVDSPSSAKSGFSSMPSYLWLGLPDPWGFLADLVAIHVRGRS
jgi:methylmalonyl-CoA/ethylmalonyl-CoA epimerase